MRGEYFESRPAAWPPESPDSFPGPGNRSRPTEAPGAAWFPWHHRLRGHVDPKLLRAPAGAHEYQSWRCACPILAGGVHSALGGDDLGALAHEQLQVSIHAAREGGDIVDPLITARRCC